MFPKIEGVSPKIWMVKIIENPIKIDDLGGKPTIFGNIQIKTAPNATNIQHLPARLVEDDPSRHQCCCSCVEPRPGSRDIGGKAEGETKPLKWWVSPNKPMGVFLLKMSILGWSFGGYHHLRKHPFGNHSVDGSEMPKNHLTSMKPCK